MKKRERETYVIMALVLCTHDLPLGKEEELNTRAHVFLALIVADTAGIGPDYSTYPGNEKSGFQR